MAANASNKPSPHPPSLNHLSHNLFPTKNKANNNNLTQVCFISSIFILAMASALSLSSSSTFVDAKALTRQKSIASSPQCVNLPLPPLQSQIRPYKATAYSRRIQRNVMAMATGTEAPPEVTTTETSEIVETVKEAWDKVEDKYAVSSLAVAVVIALWGSTGIISAIDRLPLVPGILELVGIGYTGWFAYKNVVFKPDREAFIAKIKDTYKEITGSS